MVRPIGIQHTDLRHGRIAFFVIPEICLNMQKVLEGHGQGKRTVQFPELFLLHPCKAVQYDHIRRLVENIDQGIRLFPARLPGIHGVNAVCLYSVKFLVRDITQNHIGDRGADDGLLILF